MAYGLTAQSCLPEGIIFNNQNQIDSFPINYPNCIEIEGDVVIYGDDITNLNELNALTSVGGDLWIVDNEALTSLTGLEGMISVGGDLWIYHNDALTSLTGLENVASIVHFLRIIDNNTLTSITGLEGVTSIGGDLIITFNNDLTSLVGLDNIESNSIEDLTLRYNTSLSTCEIESVCDYLIAPNGEVTIKFNSTGCNSPEEVQDSCVAHVGIIDIISLANEILI